MSRYPEHGSHIIENYASRDQFVRQLSQYEMVASTSLHGRIFAHAYCIPVAPFVLTDKVFGGDFKFRDHYSSFGIDIRRSVLVGGDPEILDCIRDAPQPAQEQVRTLKARLWDLLRAALL